MCRRGGPPAHPRAVDASLTSIITRCCSAGSGTWGRQGRSDTSAVSSQGRGRPEPRVPPREAGDKALQPLRTCILLAGPMPTWGMSPSPPISLLVSTMTTRICSSSASIRDISRRAVVLPEPGRPSSRIDMPCCEPAEERLRRRGPESLPGKRARGAFGGGGGLAAGALPGCATV